MSGSRVFWALFCSNSKRRRKGHLLTPFFPGNRQEIMIMLYGQRVLDPLTSEVRAHREAPRFVGVRFPCSDGSRRKTRVLGRNLAIPFHDVCLVVLFVVLPVTPLPSPMLLPMPSHRINTRLHISNDCIQVPSPGARDRHGEQAFYGQQFAVGHGWCMIRHTTSRNILHKIDDKSNPTLPQGNHGVHCCLALVSVCFCVGVMFIWIWFQHVTGNF